MNESIIKRYYEKNELVDRQFVKNEPGVDVIIPIKDTNELWESNLYCIYRVIPVNRLLIGDGGCIDNSVEIANKFPRVKVFDQSQYKTLGFRIQDLINRVTTSWFVYLHGDVYLPEDWYDKMIKYQNKYDFYECNRKHTILFEFTDHDQNIAKRPYSGSQMGKTEIFKKIKKIDDDYLYRNEDIIFKDLVEEKEFKYGRISNTFHYHQAMNRRGETEPSFKNIIIERELDKEWEIETCNMQARGIIKYLKPKKHLIEEANKPILRLVQLGSFDWIEFRSWVKETNPEWLKYINKKNIYIQKLKMFIKKLLGYNK